MRTALALTAAFALVAAVSAAQQVLPIPPGPLPQQPPAPAQPAPAPPASSPAPPQAAAPAQPAVPAPVIPVIPLNARTFTAPTGMLFTSVRPERVVDFETVMAYLQEAQRTATDPGVRRQAQGWRIFKQTDVGPNSSVVYVFVIDPTVPGADYSLGPILAAAYPDRIQEIWKLYTGAVIQQSISNLTPFVPPVLAPAAAPEPAVAPAPATTTPPGRGAVPPPPAGRGAPPAGRGQ